MGSANVIFYELRSIKNVIARPEAVAIFSALDCRVAIAPRNDYFLCRSPWAGRRV